MAITTKTSSDLQELQKKLTDLALKLGENAGVSLDLSVDSVKNVDEILNQVHLEYRKNKSYEGMKGIALELAAYVVTVIEKNISVGRWGRDSEEMGKETFPYYLKGGLVIFPYSWCLKKIENGEEDNVWLKFKTLVLDKVTK